MQFLTADLLFTGKGDALRNKVLVLSDDNCIAEIVDLHDFPETDNELKNYEGILCPGFVNTHCHLELSWAKELIPTGQGLDSFIQNLQQIKKEITAETCLQAIEKAYHEMQSTGTVAVADICNTTDTLKIKSLHSIYFHNFLEIFGSDPLYANIILEKATQQKRAFDESQKYPSSITPHATYSLSSELFALIGAISESILSIHHQENQDENIFFSQGKGVLAERRTRFNPGIIPFQACGKRPMESIATHFNAAVKLLLVHNTITLQQDIDFISHYFKNAYWCLCPNSNLYIENHLPDINLFKNNPLKVTLGTDSLASNHSLNMLHEIQTIQNHYPNHRLADLLQWATYNGAEFLGISDKAGSFKTKSKPGVVWIKNVDLNQVRLTSQSTSELIIPAAI